MESSDASSEMVSTDPSSVAERTRTWPARRRPIPRKGHNKSRQGCFNCKRRRVKCQETLPACNHCIRSGLLCEYPSQQTQAGSPMQVVQLPSTPGSFTLADMRLFHHFLITAYPHLPVGGQGIWVTEIPLLAHSVSGLLAGNVSKAMGLRMS